MTNQKHDEMYEQKLRTALAVMKKKMFAQLYGMGADNLNKNVGYDYQELKEKAKAAAYEQALKEYAARDAEAPYKVEPAEAEKKPAKKVKKHG